MIIILLNNFLCDITIMVMYMNKNHILNCFPYYIALVIITVFFGVIYIPSHSIVDTGSLFAQAIFIGILEELIFRYFLQNKIEKFLTNKGKNRLYSIFITALIFGLIHMTNIIQMDYSFGKAFFQSFNAILAGLLYGSIYYKDKKIIHVMILHSLYDFGAFISSPLNKTILGLGILDILLYLIEIIVFFKVIFDITDYMKDKKNVVNTIYYISCIIVLICMMLYFVII